MHVRSHEERLILVVEDSPSTRESYGLYFEALGYRVHLTQDGEEGLHAARRLHPDLIVTDYSMPRMDGFRMASRMKADTSLASVPILLITALPEFALPEASRRLFVEIFYKPVAPGRILAALARHMA